LLIIIEDLHLIYDADWVVPFFHRLLPLLPADIHLIITCRSLPPAPLWRLRSKQMLRVIDENELAFTLKETARLFETYGLSEEHARIALREPTVAPRRLRTSPPRRTRWSCRRRQLLAIEPRPATSSMGQITSELPT